MSGNHERLTQIEERLSRLFCLDAGPASEWTCRDYDGTGLWCENCETANDIMWLLGMTRAGERSKAVLATLTEESHRRCVGCGATAPAEQAFVVSHFYHFDETPNGEVVEERFVSPWTEVAP